VAGIAVGRQREILNTLLGWTMSQFDGKTVIVTGASSPIGIGAAAAHRFAAAGANVVLAARGAEGLEEVAASIGERAITCPTDVTNPAACERLVACALDRFGGLDVLVNNAGYNRRGPVADQEPEELAKIIAVNLVGPIILTRIALPALRVRRGAVVQVASIAGQIPLDGEATYSASKFGLRAFSFALRQELTNTGIRIAVVSPGPVNTGFLRDELDSVPDVVFANPMSTADEVAALVVASAADGRKERTIPFRTGLLARAAAALPLLRRLVEPLMARKGRAAKARFRDELA
jgi:short-subunit dehydrogenase